MKRLLALVVAAGLFVISVIGVTLVLKANTPTTSYVDYIPVSGTTVTEELLGPNINPNTMVVMGSSELDPNYCMNAFTCPKNLYYNAGYNFNTMLVGAGYHQSLWHAVVAGAIGNDIVENGNGKLVFIVSEDWFSGTSNGARLSSYLSDELVEECMSNPNLSDETKDELRTRLNEELGSDNDVQLELATDPVSKAVATLKSVVEEPKRAYDNWALLSPHASDESSDASSSTLDYQSIDWGSVILNATQVAAEKSSSNSYGFSDFNWSKYFTNPNLANSETKLTRNNTSEYEDMALMLKICNELGIQTMVVMLPENGRWRDYTGYPVSERQNFYESIRTICSDNDVALADFSDYEYDMYFLSDTAHPGWKGWACMNQVIAAFQAGWVTERTVGQYVSALANTDLPYYVPVASIVLGDDGSRHISGRFENTSELDESDIELTFNLYDSNGTIVGQTTVNKDSISAGGVWVFDEALDVDQSTADKVAWCELATATGSWETWGDTSTTSSTSESTTSTQ